MIVDVAYMVRRLSVVYVLLSVLNHAFAVTIVLVTNTFAESDAPSVGVSALTLQFHPGISEKQIKVN